MVLNMLWHHQERTSYLSPLGGPCCVVIVTVVYIIQTSVKVMRASLLLINCVKLASVLLAPCTHEKLANELTDSCRWPSTQDVTLILK